MESGTNQWQRGQDADGEAASDASGNMPQSVSLSADGSTVAIGARNNHGANGAGSGHVRIYKWNSISNQWDKSGQDIDGEASNDNSGTSVSMSADGSIVAIGANSNQGANGVRSGHVRVYEWDPNALNG